MVNTAEYYGARRRLPETMHTSIRTAKRRHHSTIAWPTVHHWIWEAPKIGIAFHLRQPNTLPSASTTLSNQLSPTGWPSSNYELCWKSAWFESRPGHWLSWVRTSSNPSVLLAKYQASISITWDCFLPNPFQFIVHWLLYCQRCVRDADSTIKCKSSSPFNLVILGGEGGHFI